MLLPPLANPDRIALLAFAGAIEPPPPVDLNSWAKDNVVFGSDSPFPGAYNPDRFPWNRGILEALSPDDPCQEVILQKSIQIGGTVLAQIFIGGKLDLDPGPCMFTHPVDSNARRFVRTKWRPFIRNCTSLRGLLPERSRNSGASVDYQERSDGRGYVQHGAATSPSALSQISIRDMVEDDLDKWQTDGTTGDPEKAADGRCEAYLRAGQAKIFKIGNPVLAHSSRVARGFKRGSQEHWHWECPHCHLYHPHLDWEAMRAALEGDRQRFKDEGMTDDEARDAAIRAVHVPCAGCGKEITQADWQRNRCGGAWIAHNPTARRRVRSFYLWSAFVADWAALARKWFDAKGNPEKEQSFLNEDAGLPFEAAGEAPAWEVIRDRANARGHDLGTIPEGGLILICSVDCQGDRVEAHIKVYGSALRRWTVDYRVIMGHIREDSARAGLDALLEEEWPDAFGHRRKIERLVIDAGAYKADVEAWVASKSPGRVWMVRGSKDQFAPDLVVNQSRKQRREAKKLTGRSRHTIHWVGAAVIKGQLYGCLKRSDPLGPGWCGYPRGLDDEFYRQLTSERREKRRNSRGEDEWVWVKPDNQANEVLDTEVYGQAAAVSLGWKRNDDARWEELRKRWETPADPTGQGDLFAAAAPPGRDEPMEDGDDDPAEPLPASDPPPRVVAWPLANAVRAAQPEPLPATPPVEPPPAPARPPPPPPPPPAPAAGENWLL